MQYERMRTCVRSSEFLPLRCRMISRTMNRGGHMQRAEIACISEYARRRFALSILWSSSDSEGDDFFHG